MERNQGAALVKLFEMSTLWLIGSAAAIACTIRLYSYADGWITRSCALSLSISKPSQYARGIAIGAERMKNSSFIAYSEDIWLATKRHLSIKNEMGNNMPGVIFGRI